MNQQTALNGIFNNVEQSSGMTDRERRTLLQMQRIRPLVRRQDFYMILGVSRTATTREIVTAYRELARIVAPDKNPGMDTTEIFQSVNKAYEVLSDEAKRKEYDLGGQRDEYSYEEEEDGMGDDAFSLDSLTPFLTAGIKPSDHMRGMFANIQQEGPNWKTPSQTSDQWLAAMVAKVDAIVSSRTSDPSPKQVSTDHCCLICNVVICKQSDPRLSVLETAHMDQKHNAYIARILSIRAALNNPESIEQVLYSESLPFTLPLRNSITSSGADSPLLLQELANEMRSLDSHINSELCTEWDGYSKWRRFLSFLQDSSSGSAGTLSLNTIGKHWHDVTNERSLPAGEKGTTPTPEFPVGSNVPIFSNTNNLHPSLKAVLEIPRVKSKPLPPAWKNSWSCGSCNATLFFSCSHCRACGRSLCSSCVKMQALPSYGLLSVRHIVCPLCESRKLSNQADSWKSWALLSDDINKVLSGALGVLFFSSGQSLYPFKKFTFQLGIIDYLRCAFLCSDVPPINEPGASLVYRQREAWLRFATSSLRKASELSRSSNQNQNKEIIAELRARVRVSIIIARLLALSPDITKPDQCWDAERLSLFNAKEEGVYLLCLLHESKGDWRSIGELFLNRKWLVPAMSAFRIADRANFNESEFLMDLAAKQSTPTDTIFFTAAATLLHESDSTILRLANESKKVGELLWTVDILCAGWNYWKDSPSKKVKGHVLLMDCFESLIPDSLDVLLAGYKLLCQLTEGELLAKYQKKLQALQDREINLKQEEVSQASILRTLRYELSLNSPEQFASLLLKAFQEEDVEELQHIIAHQRHTYRSVTDHSRLPAPVRANLLFPEAILIILEQRDWAFMEGIRKLLDALLLSIGSGHNAYLNVATEVLFAPKTRYLFLNCWKDHLQSCSTLKDLITGLWLQDIAPIYDRARTANFQFGNSLRNSPELRAQRLIEKAIDSVATRDGPFEAAMSCLDAMTICVGQGARLNMLLKVSRYLYNAITISTSSINYQYACLALGNIILQLVSRTADRLSPVLRSYFARQVVFQQLLFLEKASTLSPGRVPAEMEEWLKLSEMAFTSFVELYGGFPIYCSVQARAFDDIISEMVFDQLSDKGITYLESHLAGLVTIEQWTYWRFEGAWQQWLHNPLNDELEAKHLQHQFDKQQRALERQQQEDREPTATELAQEQREETEYLRKRALEMSQNNCRFLEQERTDAIIRYLEEKKWSWEQVSRLINCMCVPRTPDGFIDPNKSYNPRDDFIFSSFDGFEIDHVSGTIRFLLTEARKSGKPALFGWREIREIFSTGAPAMVFSLDAIEANRQVHPFQILHYKPARARGTTVLSCMFHTDYLLKFLTCGLEISCQPPFAQRDIRNGFFRRFPCHIQNDLSVIWGNGMTRSTEDQAHRFWIDAGLLPYSEIRTEEQYRIVYGKQSMRVKKHKLRRNAQGELVDDDEINELADHEDREYQFAQNFTKHYDTIANIFPEFAMLAEFTKMIAATTTLLCEAENCKTNIKHIQEQIPKIANTIESSLRNQLQDIVYPLEGSRKIDELIEDHVRETDKLNNYRLTYAQKQEVRQKARTEYQRQAREADNRQVNSLASSLGVSPTTVRDMLLTKDYYTIAYQQARNESSKIIQKFENVLKALRSEGLPVDGDVLTEMRTTMSEHWSTAPASDFPCEWVPAVFRTATGASDSEASSTYRVYGGVSLQAQLNQQRSLNPPATSQQFTSTTTLSAQRAVGAPFSTAATIDNRNRANQDFFQRHQQVCQQIANQRQMNQHQQMIASFRNQQSSTGTLNNPVQVRRYASGPSGFVGAYWTADQFNSRQTARERLAILPEWNTMKYLVVGTIPTTPQAPTVYKGTAAPQGRYEGGASQYLIPQVWGQRQIEIQRVYKHEWSPRFFETWKQVK